MYATRFVNTRALQKPFLFPSDLFINNIFEFSLPHLQALHQQTEKRPSRLWNGLPKCWTRSSSTTPSCCSRRNCSWSRSQRSWQVIWLVQPSCKNKWKNRKKLLLLLTRGLPRLPRPPLISAGRRWQSCRSAAGRPLCCSGSNTNEQQTTSWC